MKTLLTTILGNKKGLLSLISEKTGKVSFRRVGGIMTISYIINSVPATDLKPIHAILIVTSLVSIILPKIIKKDI